MSLFKETLVNSKRTEKTKKTNEPSKEQTKEVNKLMKDRR